jgi:hypothetical protein
LAPYTRLALAADNDRAVAPTALVFKKLRRSTLLRAMYPILHSVNVDSARSAAVAARNLWLVSGISDDMVGCHQKGHPRQAAGRIPRQNG